jgi:signal transduction histidine kinase
MARARPVTPRHLVVTVLVVFLVNLQLTWWLVFALRQNRERLDLDRARLADSCRVEAARVQTELERARARLERWMASSGIGGGNARWPMLSMPEPFELWLSEEDLAGVPGWHADDAGRLRLELLCSGAICGAATGERWGRSLISPSVDLEVVDAATAGGEVSMPSWPLPAPFEGLEVRPAAGVWATTLDDYRGRIVMMVSEGAFFAVMLFVLIGLLWRTLRREVELERQHRNFLSAITHELKSPLASMRLSLETVLSGRVDQQGSAKFLGNALQDTERLQGLVQKVLEATRFGHGGRLQIGRVCVSDTVTAAVEAVRPRVTSLGGSISSDVTPDCEAGVDEEAFRIVVSNLLENAVSYGGTPPRITVRLSLDADRAVLEIADNGPGIADDEMPLVFEKFYRSGDELSRTTQGTGLGLYLVRQIVRAHRGTVRIATTGPDGTTFRVEIPGAELKGDGA